MKHGQSRMLYACRVPGMGDKHSEIGKVLAFFLEFVLRVRMISGFPPPGWKIYISMYKKTNNSIYKSCHA
jgi:hypothetical protein